jgi:exonuclease V gamma subunit
LGRALLADLRAGTPSALALQRLAASARLPAGEPGQLAARALRAEVDAIAESARSRLGADTLLEQPFDLTLVDVPSVGAARISGLLRDVGPNGLVRIDFSRIGRRRELEFWIEHLVLCALVEQGADFVARSLLVSRAESASKPERVVIFKAVPEAHRELAQLFEWAWSVDRAPLPFFPDTSRAFGRRWAQGKHDQAWREAHQKFYGGESREFDFPESEEDLELARVWEGALPLESASDQPVLFRFEALAQRFFEPFLAAREVHKR